MRRALGALICAVALASSGRAQAQEPNPSPSPQQPEPSPTPEPSPSPVPEAPPPPPPPPSAPAPSSKVFNPDMAVIGNFTGAVGENDVDPRPSLSLEESEVSLQAVVDPYARADFFLTFSNEEVGVEEGYITFTSLPAGFLLKVGKMKASFGKVNQMHPHVLPWVDLPLPMVNLLGGEEGLNDAGLSLSRLFPNSFVFLEATGEVYRGEVENLFAAPRRQDVALVGRLRAYRDLSESTNLEAGGSVAHGTNDAGPGYHTDVFGADVSLRWRPLRRAIYHRFLLRSELFWSRREHPQGTVVDDTTGAVTPVGNVTAKAFGYYVSADYQLGRRWFAGGRYDWSERALEPDLHDRAGSLLLTYWPSEFSQIRGQFRHTSYAEGSTASEFLFQFLFSIGAHGAHPF
jgi:hypothetical protein